jgi:hypothetical protein
MNPVRRNFLAGLIVLSGMMFAARPAAAQATFQVSAATSTVTTTGHTEPIGEVTFTIIAGTSSPGLLEVSYPVAFTNDAATGISVLGTGGLAGATVSVAASSGIVIVNVPAGGVVGNSVTVMGARFSPSTFNGTIMTATVSSAGNFITAGQGVVTVVGGAASGLTLTANPSPAFSVANGLIVTPPSDFVITEGHAAAFTSDVGVKGQTVPT